MAWQDDLRLASFRSVPFHVDQAGFSMGRRLARHEYPQRDQPYLEDMGRKAREYKIEAFIIGPDYMADRDDLIKAMEEAGAGQLVHPYYGTLSVTVSDCDLTESTNAGGLAKFTITFVEAGRQQEPKSGTDTQTILVHAIDDSDGAFTQDFTESFSVDDAPEFVSQDALDSVNDLLAHPGIDLGNLAWIRTDPLNALTALLPENLSASLRDPATLAGGILALVKNATNMLSVLDFSLSPVGGSSVTTSRLQQNTNRAALDGLVRQAATAQRIGALAYAGAVTVDDARQSRSEIVSLADTVLLNESTGQRAADSIIQIRTDAISHFGVITPDLPKLVSITEQTARPAWVIAHDFYGDDWYGQSREDELIARNSVRHPGFVRAGYPLQVLA